MAMIWLKMKNSVNKINNIFNSDTLKISDVILPQGGLCCTTCLFHSRYIV
jgi:hypothetical protein